jgi:hypothetical protein
VKIAISLVLSLLTASLVSSQTGRTQIPAGVRQAEQAQAQAERDVPPPQTHKKTIDAAKLQQDADELASLASSIPPAIDQANHGVLPKDVPEKLKRIEKLAKQLRTEMNP